MISVHTAKNIGAVLLSGVPVALGLVVGRYAASDSSGASDASRDGWYEGLDKPAYTPPSLAFSVVWPVLYVLMGLAAFLAYAWGRRPILIVYGALFFNLAFNLAFPLVQFRLRNLFWAMVIVWATLVTALLLTYALTVGPAKSPSKTVVHILLLPYVLWLVFASVLSTDIYVRNRGKNGSETLAISS
jgi:tryptophan-rich sensory protein